MKDSKRDFYSVLNVTRTASSAEIKRAFLDAAKRLHPDKLANADTAQQKVATENFQLLNEAYETLIDDAKRRSYDARPKEMTFSEFDPKRASYQQNRNHRASDSQVGSNAGFSRRKGLFFFLKFSVIMSALMYKYLKDVIDTRSQWEKAMRSGEWPEMRKDE